MKFFSSCFSTAIATFVALWLVPGISVVGNVYAGPIAMAIVLSLLNATIKPLLQVLSLPITCLTMGIFALFVNAMVLELASNLSQGIFQQGIAIDGLGSAILASLLISIVSSFVNEVIFMQD